ncbi:hypothetical protein AK812_SmicGene45218, partial [Symbiodinium microadriaticum]
MWVIVRPMLPQHPQEVLGNLQSHLHADIPEGMSFDLVPTEMVGGEHACYAYHTTPLGSQGVLSTLACLHHAPSAGLRGPHHSVRFGAMEALPPFPERLARLAAQQQAQLTRLSEVHLAAWEDALRGELVDRLRNLVHENFDNFRGNVQVDAQPFWMPVYEGKSDVSTGLDGFVQGDFHGRALAAAGRLPCSQDHSQGQITADTGE